MKPTVTVRATWESEHTYEFETQEEADDFEVAVAEGGEAGLSATVENNTNELESGTAELTGFEVA